MILTSLLTVGAVILGVGLLATFWNDMVSWLKRAVQKVKEVIGVVSYGFTVFVRKLREGLKEISKHYSKKQNKWQETIVTKEIDESEVPDEIKAKASMSRDVEITDELEMKLESA